MFRKKSYYSKQYAATTAAHSKHNFIFRTQDHFCRCEQNMGKYILLYRSINMHFRIRFTSKVWRMYMISSLTIILGQQFMVKINIDTNISILEEKAKSTGTRGYENQMTAHTSTWKDILLATSFEKQFPDTSCNNCVAD